MTPIPLPLIDGAFIIDNSSIEKYKCPRAFQYGVHQRRVATSARAGANFGSTVHRGLETRYRFADVGDVDSTTKLLIQSAMHEWLEGNPQPDMDFRNYNHAVRMLDVYNQIYPRESFELLSNPNGKPLIEASFCLPLGMVQNVPILYSGKIDLGIRDSNGIWSFDHKTAFQFGETFDKQMSMDGGQLGYCWALGQTLGVAPCGYIIDAIRVRKPSRMSEFDGKAPIDGTDFKRIPFYVLPETLEEWKRDVLTIVSDIFACFDRGNFPRHRWQCTNKFGVCEYYDCCSSREDARKQILASGLYEDSQWMMGLKTETKNKES
jgi:hypothetical protein